MKRMVRPVVVLIALCGLVASGLWVGKRIARSTLIDALASVAANSSSWTLIASNPFVLSTSMRNGPALQGLVRQGTWVDAGEINVREPGYLFQVDVTGEIDLLCLVRPSEDWAVYCADVSNLVFDNR